MVKHVMYGMGESERTESSVEGEDWGAVSYACLLVRLSFDESDVITSDVITWSSAIR